MRSKISKKKFSDNFHILETKIGTKSPKRNWKAKKNYLNLSSKTANLTKKKCQFFNSKRKISQSNFRKTRTSKNEKLHFYKHWLKAKLILKACKWKWAILTLSRTVQFNIWMINRLQRIICKKSPFDRISGNSELL